MSTAIQAHTYTEYFKGLIPSDVAIFAYNHLRDGIDWVEGVRSKSGFTRLAKSIDMTENDVVQQLILCALKGVSNGKNKMKTVSVLGVYLNYYKTGDMYTPAHSHKGTSQLIISLGETRTLNVGKKSYPMANGDVAIFGGSIHGIPKEETSKGRISVAVFLKIKD